MNKIRRKHEYENENGNEKRKWPAAMLACLLSISLLSVCSFTGCSQEAGTSGTVKGNGKYSSGTVQLSVEDGQPSLDDEAGYCFVGEEQGLTNFSVRLLKESFQTEENSMISPLSLMTALAMVGMGAEGETLTQLETALDSDLTYFINYLGTFYDSLEGRGAKFTSANSIWFRDDAERLTVSETFLTDVQGYFDADVFKAAFDQSTVKDINRWCDEATDGMIPELLEKINPDEVIHLINAISFDGVWESPYASYETGAGEFHNQDGSTSMAKYMYSTEWSYLEDESVEGFLKPYEGGYSFMALLPKEEKEGNVDGDTAARALSNYVDSLTGVRFCKILDSASEEPVQVALPKFTSEYNMDFIPVLQAMGIMDLFDVSAADLTKMATSSYGNICVSKVFQKTFIEVDTEGTRAAAVTDIIAADEAALETEKQIILNRPFLYAIIDDNTGVPVFIGAVTNL